MSLLQSCNAQSDFDMTNIKFNVDNISVILPKNIKSVTHNRGISPEYKETTISSHLYFAGIDFSGKNPKAPTQNCAVFFYNTKNNLITEYWLNVLDTKQSEQLLKKLKERLGKPNYTEFKTPIDKTNNNPNKLIWEDVKNNRFYYLSYTEQHYGRDAQLIVMPILEKYPGYIISYWEDFTDERTKRKDPNFTYQDYLKYRQERYGKDDDVVKRTK
ncbi:MAG: hypothetical protein CSA38_02245 [Flavobacteriales bacterium]|nr:MAG: hypothetical protein CSA38_02245 [Flavobacteriales bacterium]